MEYDLYEKQQDPPFLLSLFFYSLATINLGIIPFLDRLKEHVFPKIPFLKYCLFFLMIVWVGATAVMLPKLVSMKTKVRGKITFTDDSIDFNVDEHYYHVPFDEIEKVRIQQLAHRFRIIELQVFSLQHQFEYNIRFDKNMTLKSFRDHIRLLYRAGIPVKEIDLRGRKSFLLVANRTFQEIQILKEKYNIEWT